MEIMPFIIFSVLIFIFLWAGSRKTKGKVGEGIVGTVLKHGLDKNLYRTINDVTLPALSGTTQIDHILVAKTNITHLKIKNSIKF